MDRVILHCDINNFYASVELLDHPELKGLPVAVSGDPENRHGIILAKNQEAKSAGVKTAETIWQARKKCPGLILLPPHHKKYRHFNRLINAIFMEYTDLVEPFSIDESWLDVTASRRLFGSGKEIADRIRERVRSELGITLSAGVSYNKIFAKMGSEYKKPDATTVISRANYKDILWPMPVSELFFVGYATAGKLKDIGINTIGDLALANVSALEKLLGKQGPLLRTYARGEDMSPVRHFDQKEKIKSVGNGMTFRRDLKGPDDIMTALTSLCDTVAGRLRKYQVKAGGVKVDIRDPSFRNISRQKQLASPTNLAEDFRTNSFGIIKKLWDMDAPIRQITVTAISLTDENAAEQLSLLDPSGNLIMSRDRTSGSDPAGRARSESVERAMDEIRRRFGDDAIGFGRILGNDIGVDL